MCKINSSEQNILSYKCNGLNFSELEFNSALLANFVSTKPENFCARFFIITLLEVKVYN